MTKRNTQHDEPIVDEDETAAIVDGDETAAIVDEAESAAIVDGDETAAIEDESETAIEGESLEEAIAKLTPEQADMFMRALALTMRKRRLMLVGNLTALLCMIIGVLFAFVAYGNRQPGSFAGWVFLVPFGSAGFVLWFFGKLAKRAGTKTHQTLIEPITDAPETSP